MIGRLALLPLACALVAASPPPVPPRGAQVFAKWCAPCHGPGPGHPGTAALEAKYGGTVPPELERRQDLTPEIIALYVRHGVSLMAPFRKTEIGDADLAELGHWLSPSPAPKEKRR